MAQGVVVECSVKGRSRLTDRRRARPRSTAAGDLGVYRVILDSSLLLRLIHRMWFLYIYKQACRLHRHMRGRDDADQTQASNTTIVMSSVLGGFEDPVRVRLHVLLTKPVAVARWRLER